MPTGTLPTGTPRPPVAEKSQPVDAVTIDRGISEQLKRARFHVWVADLVGVLALWLAVTLMTFVVASACEHWIAPFGVLGRTVFLSGLVGLAVYFIGWRLAPLLLRRINNVFAARVIEQHDPTLKNSVINFLYVKDESVGAKGGMHEVIVENLRRKAAADLTRVQVDAAVDRTTMFRYAYALAGVVALLGAYKVLSPKDPFVTVARVLAPWAQIAPPCRVTIVSVKPGDVELTQGEVLPVEVEIEGLRQGEIPRVVYSTADGRLTDQSVPLTAKAGFQFEAKLPATAAEDVAQQGLQQDIVYRIEAGDAVGFTHRVKVRSVSTIDVQRVDLAFPDYTGRGRETLERTGDVRAVEGTRVTLHARANRAIRSAEAEFFTPGTIVDESGVRKPAAKIPLTVAAGPGESGESDRKSAHVSFVLMLQPDGKPKYDSYQLRFISEDQQTSSEPVVHQLDVLPDLAPEVEIIRPDAAVTEVAVDDSAAVDVRGLDPDFGLRRITVKLLRGGKELPAVTLLDEAGGKRGPTVQSWTFKPSELGLQVGDEVRVWAVAEDNRSTPKGNSILEAKLSSNPNVSQSNVKTFSIVPPQPGKEENGENQSEESPEQPKKNRGKKKGSDENATKSNSPENDESQKESDPSRAEKNESKNGDKGKSKSNKDGAKNKPDNDKADTGDEPKSPMNEGSDENQSDQDDSESAKDDRQNSDEQKNDNKKQPKGRNDRNKSKANDNDQKSAGNGGSGGESSEEEKQSDQAGKSKEQGGGSAGENSESSSENASNEQGGDSGTESGSNSKSKPSNKQGSGDDGSDDGAGESSKQSKGSAGGNKGKSGGERSTEPGNENGEERNEDSTGAPESDSNNQQGGEGKGKPSQKKLHDGEVIEKALQHKKESEGSEPSQPSGEERPSGDSTAGGKQGGERNGPEGENTQPKATPQGGGKEGDPNGKGAAKGTTGSGGASKEEQEKGDGGNSAEQGATKSKTGENAGKGSAPKDGNGKLDKSSKGTDATGGQQPKPNDPSTEPEQDPNAPDKLEGAGDPGSEGSGNPDTSKEKGSSGAEGQKANADTKKDPDKGAKAPDGGDPGGVSQSNKQSNSKGGASGDQSGGGSKGGGQSGKQKGNDSPGTQSAGDSGNGAANEEGQGEDSNKAGTQKQAAGKTGQSTDKTGDGSATKADESGKTPGKGGTDGNNPNTTSKKTADAQSKQGKGPVTGGGAPTDGNVDNSVPPPGPKGEVPEGDEANEAYAKKATDLALQHLREQQDNPDPELLKELGWTKDELRAFLDRWDAMKKAAERSPEAAERLEESYKSLGIRPAGDKRRGGGTRSDNNRDLRDAGGRSDPPASYADQFRAFRKGAKPSSGGK